MKRFFLTVISLCFASMAYAQQPNWQSVQDVFNSEGKTEDSALRISLSRDDLSVQKDDVQLEPDLGLDHEISFQGNETRAMVAAELALQENEVEPVLLKMFAAGFSVTGIHNHLIGTKPVIIFVHMEAIGNPVTLSQKLKAAIPSGWSPQPPLTEKAAQSKPAWVAIQNALGVKGEAQDNVMEISIPRNERITNHETPVDPLFGVESELYFQVLGTDTVSATGDLVLLNREVEPVAKALRDSGFEVTALHNHFTFENPRLFYLHFWATGSPSKVAGALKNVLAKTNSKL